MLDKWPTLLVLFSFLENVYNISLTHKDTEKLNQVFFKKAYVWVG